MPREIFLHRSSCCLEIKGLKIQGEKKLRLKRNGISLSAFHLLRNFQQYGSFEF